MTDPILYPGNSQLLNAEGKPATGWQSVECGGIDDWAPGVSASTTSTWEMMHITQVVTPAIESAEPLAAAHLTLCTEPEYSGNCVDFTLHTTACGKWLR